MKVYSYIGDDLDSGVPTNERTSEKGDYAIFVRDGIEPDTDLRNTSANQIAKKKLQTMTLLERLLLELFYFHFTGEHLDVNGWTICAGSRFSDGNVACVYWYSNGGEVLVGWCNTSFSDDDAGARAVQQ